MAYRIDPTALYSGGVTASGAVETDTILFA
jgi:hypothetical protein